MRLCRGQSRKSTNSRGTRPPVHWIVLLAAWLGLHGVVLAQADPRAHSWLFVSLLRERKIVTFERNPQTGELVRRCETVCPAEPAILSVSPDRKTLFASFRSSGELASFAIHPETGELDRLSVVDGGADPAYLLADRQGRYLLTAYYVANKVTLHALGENGAIRPKPLQTIPTAEKAHGIAIDASNQLVFVTHTGADRIYQFRFDPQQGRLAASEPPFVSTPAGTHPRHVVLHPSARWAYVGNEAGDSLSVYAVNPQAGTLSHLQTVPTLPEGFDGGQNATARCEMTADGRFVYVANRGHDSIAGFAIDPTTGLVTSLGQTPTEKTPRSFTIEPTGRFLYVAGEGSGRIAAYRIQESGPLARFVTYDAGPVAWAVLAVDTP